MQVGGLFYPDNEEKYFERRSERYYVTKRFFDNETKALIDLNVIYGAGKRITNKCLIIFSKEIHTYLLEHYECEIIGEIGACNGNIPIYCLEYKGEKIAFYLTGIGSAVASSMCYESHHVIGATKYIMFGSCGSLDKEATKGKFIIPTESYRGEGASHYYARLTFLDSKRRKIVVELIKISYIKSC